MGTAELRNHCTKQSDASTATVEDRCQYFVGLAKSSVLRSQLAYFTFWRVLDLNSGTMEDICECTFGVMEKNMHKYK